MTKILVTGANGYIGSHVVKKLLDKNRHVVAVDFNQDRVDLRAEYLKLNIFEDKDIFSKTGNPDICLHLAWKDGFNHQSENHICNLPLHFNFLKNLVDNGIKQLAVMGTMHEIGYYEGCIDEKTPCNPLSFYGIAKNALRQTMNVYLHNKNIAFQWLRAFYITGDDRLNKSVFSKIIEMEKAGYATFPFTSGLCKYDFESIEDLTTQIGAVITQNNINGVINCCSGKAVALKDKVEEFLTINHFKIRPEYGTYPEREYDSPAIWGNNEKIEKIMGVLK